MVGGGVVLAICLVINFEYCSKFPGGGGGLQLGDKEECHGGAPLQRTKIQNLSPKIS